MNLLLAVGTVLRAARLESDLSQEKLAAQAGVYRNTVGLIERGDMSVSLLTLDQICHALGCRPWQVLLEAEFLIEESGADGSPLAERQVTQTSVAVRAAAAKKRNSKTGRTALPQDHSAKPSPIKG